MADISTLANSWLNNTRLNLDFTEVNDLYIKTVYCWYPHNYNTNFINLKSFLTSYFNSRSIAFDYGDRYSSDKSINRIMIFLGALSHHRKVDNFNGVDYEHIVISFDDYGNYVESHGYKESNRTDLYGGEPYSSCLSTTYGGNLQYKDKPCFIGSQYDITAYNSSIPFIFVPSPNGDYRYLTYNEDSKYGFSDHDYKNLYLYDDNGNFVVFFNASKKPPDNRQLSFPAIYCNLKNDKIYVHNTLKYPDLNQYIKSVTPSYTNILGDVFILTSRFKEMEITSSWGDQQDCRILRYNYFTNTLYTNKKFSLNLKSGVVNAVSRVIESFYPINVYRGNTWSSRNDLYVFGFIENTDPLVNPFEKFRFVIIKTNTDLDAPICTEIRLNHPFREDSTLMKKYPEKTLLSNENLDHEYVYLDSKFDDRYLYIRFKYTSGTEYDNTHGVYLIKLDLFDNYALKLCLMYTKESFPELSHFSANNEDLYFIKGYGTYDTDSTVSCMKLAKEDIDTADNITAGKYGFKVNKDQTLIYTTRSMSFTTKTDIEFIEETVNVHDTPDDVVEQLVYSIENEEKISVESTDTNVETKEPELTDLYGMVVYDGENFRVGNYSSPTRPMIVTSKYKGGLNPSSSGGSMSLGGVYISFPYDYLFYEPKTKNKFKYIGKEKIQLTNDEITELESFCEVYFSQGDFYVNTYAETDPKLYKGYMSISDAASKNLGIAYDPEPLQDNTYIRNVSANMWIKIAGIIDENGKLVENPTTIPENVIKVLDYDQLKVFPRPSNDNEIWDDTLYAWKDGRILSDVKSSAVLEIKNKINVKMMSEHPELYMFDISTASVEYGEANAYIANSSAETPYIDAMLAVLGGDKLEYCNNIITTYKSNISLIAEYNIKQQQAIKQVKDATTNSDVDEILENFLNG